MSQFAISATLIRGIKGIYWLMYLGSLRGRAGSRHNEKKFKPCYQPSLSLSLPVLQFWFYSFNKHLLRDYHVPDTVNSAGRPHPEPLLSAWVPGSKPDPTKASPWVLAARVPPPPRPPLAALAPVGVVLGLPLRCLVQARVLQTSTRNRCWWEEHLQRWGWHSRSRDLPRGLGGLLGRQG